MKFSRSEFLRICKPDEFRLTTLDEDTLVLRSTILAHLENYVLETGCLGSWPMYSRHRRRCRYIGHVDNEIPDLSIKSVGATVTSISRALVWACINDSQTPMEVGSGSQDWGTIRIADELGLIVVDLYGQNAVRDTVGRRLTIEAVRR